MTTLTSARGRREPGPAGQGPSWRDLGWVTWRQHRTSFTWAIGASLALAAASAALGLYMRGAGSGLGAVRPEGYLVLLLALAPLGTGLFVGAPLLSGESERGTMRFVLTQAVSRRRWMTAQVVPVALALALAGAAVGLVFRWAIEPVLAPTDRPWGIWLFPLNPLPFAGWLVLGFSLGVMAGALTRRLLPAIAVTVVGYLTTFVLAGSWRDHYLPPSTEALAPASASKGAYAYRIPGNIDRLRAWLGWPSGRPLPADDRFRPTVWFAAHHIKVWISYQPFSRFAWFELIEFGWLIAASLLLAAGALILISRRPA
jgi:hypothetical protein